MSKNSNLALNHNHHSDYLICPCCDALMQKPSLNHQEKAYCSVCDALVLMHRCRSFAHYTAWIMTSIIVFAVCFYLPFLTMSIGGFKESMTLWSLPLSLWNSEYQLLGVIIVMVLVIAPLVQSLSLLLMFAALRYRLSDIAIWNMKIITQIDHWNMLDVYLVGVLVTYIKLSSMGTLEFNAGFWVYILLVLINFKIYSMIDREWLWKNIHQLKVRYE